jgi:2-polyprenyl-3-methyl-5-hydroxy-6-metoxy-1,4-benzoquinol methylase
MPHIFTCRFCKKETLQSYLDLGFTPLADRFLTEQQFREPEPYYPLVVALCTNCGLSQLNHTVDPSALYQEDYPYSMSLTKTGDSHYGGFADAVVKKFGLTKGDLVVDVGSNVGVLLSGFKRSGVKVLGVDPAKNMAAIANKRGIKTIADFFVPAVAQKARKKFGPAKVIVGTNVFAHIFDHHQFVSALKTMLDKDGIFIFESPSFVNLVNNLEYDTIYHEHLLYLSLKPVIRFFKENGMEVFDVENYPIHGGSFRVFAARKGAFPVRPAVKRQLALEAKSGIHSLARLKKFAKDVEKNRHELQQLIVRLRRQGKSIAILSTPAKGMTLLNYCRIGPEHASFATEKSDLKIGRYTPGTHIPIFSDKELLLRQPDYALLLAWNFGYEIMKNQAEYRKKGGKFIIPIPKPRIHK